MAAVASSTRGIYIDFHGHWALGNNNDIFYSERKQEVLAELLCMYVCTYM